MFWSEDKNTKYLNKIISILLKRGVEIRKKKIVKEGQAWSVDLIIAVVIFVLIISIVYTFINRPTQLEPQVLKNEGKNIAVKLNTGGKYCEIITNNVIDRDQLITCYKSLPEVWKREMNIRQNFCIYITDQSGRIISVDNYTGFGIDELNVSGTLCSQKVS